MDLEVSCRGRVSSCRSLAGQGRIPDRSTALPCSPFRRWRHRLSVWLPQRSEQTKTLTARWVKTDQSFTLGRIHSNPPFLYALAAGFAPWSKTPSRRGPVVSGRTLARDTCRAGAARGRQDWRGRRDRLSMNGRLVPSLLTGTYYER